jgi:hypothetical protein
MEQLQPSETKMPEDISTLNDCMVAVRGEGILIMRQLGYLDKETALRLAAWIVACTGEKERFDKIFEAVCST